MTATTSPKSDYTGRKTILMAFAGFITSFAFIRGARALGVNLYDLSVIDVAAFIQALVFGMIGLIAIAITLSPSLAGRQIEQNPDAPPATRKELRIGRLQGLVFLLASVLLLTPLVATARGLAPSSTPWYFAGIVVAFLLQSFLNIRLWLQADEFLRATLERTCTITFWVLQGGLFLAASAQRLGLLPNFSLWSAMVITLGVYSLATLYISWRTCPPR